jgi:hypothetical protein
LGRTSFTHMGGGGPAAPRRPQDVLDAVPTGVDVALSCAAGLTAATCMSPFILTIDRAVTEYAAGRSGLMKALTAGTNQIVRTPLKVFASPAIAMVIGTYGLTYMAQNSINAISERKHLPKAQHTVRPRAQTTRQSLVQRPTGSPRVGKRSG